MRSFFNRRAMRWIGVVCSLTLLGTFLAGVDAPAGSAKTRSPRVLYVGSLSGVTTPTGTTFPTIQAAVNAATPGDWILIAPGDYHEAGDMGADAPSPSDLADGWYGSVDVSTPRIHLRGMDRNSVIVDGTLPSAAAPCSSAPSDQNTLNGEGRNGILIWRASGVSVDNLTVCNFLAGSGDAGNGIWWNGKDGTFPAGVQNYSGSYLTATSTYFAGSDPSNPSVCDVCALYGIFSSNSSGPSNLSQLYANNFSDSGVYVGACRRACSVTIDHAWMENNALGYSGTNSGGQVVVQNSTFDNNKDGFDTNTALTGDPPPPQNGRCWATKSPSCWVFTGNLIQSNNNPNVPISGTAGLGPTGTGMTISGGRYDVITNNRFLDNEAWGIALAPYPDGNATSDGRTCTGTKGVVATSLGVSGVSCLYDPFGVAVENNQFAGNGSFGNPSNADYANLLASGNEPVNCFPGNTEWDSTFTHPLGAATSGNALDGHPEQTPGTCGTRTPKTGLLGVNTDTTLLLQLECASGLLSGSTCGSAHYPQPTAVVMHPLPTLPSMPNPCSGVPSNLWCPGGAPVANTAATNR